MRTSRLRSARTILVGKGLTLVYMLPRAHVCIYGDRLTHYASACDDYERHVCPGCVCSAITHAMFVQRRQNEQVFLCALAHTRPRRLESQERREIVGANYCHLMETSILYAWKCFRRQRSLVGYKQENRFLTAFLSRPPHFINRTCLVCMGIINIILIVINSVYLYV